MLHSTKMAVCFSVSSVSRETGCVGLSEISAQDIGDIRIPVPDSVADLLRRKIEVLREGINGSRQNCGAGRRGGFKRNDTGFYGDTLEDFYGRRRRHRQNSMGAPDKTAANLNGEEIIRSGCR